MTCIGDICLTAFGKGLFQLDVLHVTFIMPVHLVPSGGN